MGVVHRRWNAHTFGAASVCVAEVVAELLQLVGSKICVVVDDVVMRGPARSLYPGMTAEEEVEVDRVGHHRVHGRAGRNVDGWMDAMSVPFITGW